MEKKIFLVFVFGVLFLSFVSAEVVINPSSGVQYEKEIIDLFDSGEEWVEVEISFKDNSGIIYSGNKTEILTQRELKDEWFSNEINDFIEELSNDKHEIIGRVSNGVSINLTKSTFDKIIEDGRIEKVTLSKGGTIQFAHETDKTFNYIISLPILLIIILIILIIKYNKRKN